MNQIIRFVAIGVDGEPNKQTKGHVVKQSGFWLSVQTPVLAFPNGDAKELVWRTAQASNGAEAGLLDRKAQGMFQIGI
jgi:hypothetical protein